MKKRIFPNLPDVEPISNNAWKLQCRYRGPLIDKKRTLVEHGLITDGASIPRWAWCVIGHPMQIPLLAAAVLHDAEYMAELYPRKVCDKRFLVAMKQLKISRWKRNVIYFAVRIGGGFVWNKHIDADTERAKRMVSSSDE